MQRTITSKALSLFLALALVLGMAPLTAFAYNVSATTGTAIANGVTATLTFDISEATSAVTASPANASSGVTTEITITPKVGFTNAAIESGKFTVTLSSVQSNYNDSFEVDVNAGDFIGGPMSRPSVVVHDKDVTDFVVALAFAPTGVTQYTVTFNSNGGSAVSAQNVVSGQYATWPSLPTKAGHLFAGWYTDAGLTNRYNFATPVTANITLYARWFELKVTSVSVDRTSLPVAGGTVTVTIEGSNLDFADEAGLLDVRFKQTYIPPAPTAEYGDFEFNDDGSIATIEIYFGNNTSGTAATYSEFSASVDGGATWFANKSAIVTHAGRSGSDSGSSSSGSGSSGGSSSGNVSTAATRPSANVSANGSVDSSRAVADLKSALKSVPAGGSATVTVRNAVSISASAIKSLAREAANTGRTAVIQADTLAADGSIQGRLYLEPAKLAGITGDIKLGITTQGRAPEQRKMTFEKFFNNQVSVVSCAQQGSFGAKLKIAAKVELPKNTDNLVLYSFDAATNKFTKIETTYRIDKNGYIHFETELAGDIIISDGPLKKK